MKYVLGMWALALTLAACDGEGDDSTRDAQEIQGQSCSINQDLTAAVSQIQGFQNAQGDTVTTVYTAATSEQAPADRITIEMFGILGGPAKAGTYTFNDDNYENCGLCMRVATACGASGCEKEFLANAGTLDITEWEATDYGAFKGTITDLELIEVTVNENFVSTPVPNGDRWCISSYNLEATFPGPPEVTCDTGQTTFAPTTASAVLAGMPGERNLFLDIRNPGPPLDVLNLELYEGFGATIEPGVYPYEYRNYAQCHTCATLAFDCDSGGGCSNGNYLLVSGELEITAVGSAGEQLTGALRNLEFFEHDFDIGTFESTPIEGGRSFCIDELPFDALICAVGTADCDEDASNACETDLRTNVAHCGRCGNACNAGQQCAEARCL